MLIRGRLPPEGGSYTGEHLSGSNDLSGWTFRSVMAADVDMLDFPILVGTEPITGVVITVSDRQTLFEGRVHEEQGQGASQVAVIVYPRDRRYWFAGSRYVAMARPDTDGRFSVRGLPEGPYDLALVTTLSASWQEAAFPERLTALASVTMREGQPIVRDLGLR